MQQCKTGRISVAQSCFNAQHISPLDLVSKATTSCIKACLLLLARCLVGANDTITVPLLHEPCYLEACIGA